MRKRQRRLGEVDEVVLIRYAKWLTTGEISAHFADVYGASVFKDTDSRITDRVVEEMQAWWARPLEKVYAAIFTDAIVVTIREQPGPHPTVVRSTYPDRLAGNRVPAAAFSQVALNRRPTRPGE